MNRIPVFGLIAAFTLNVSAAEPAKVLNSEYLTDHPPGVSERCPQFGQVYKWQVKFNRGNAWSKLAYDGIAPTREANPEVTQVQSNYYAAVNHAFHDSLNDRCAKSL